MVDSRAGLGDSFKSGAIIESFAGVDGEDGKSQFRLQFIEYRFARAGGNALDRALNDASDGVALLLVEGNSVAEPLGVRLGANLNELCVNGDTFGGELLFGDTSGYYACRCFPCGSPASASPVPDTVFLFVRLIGMSGPIGVFEPFIVFGSGIFIANDEGNRGAKGDTVQYSGEPFHFVGFVLGARRNPDTFTIWTFIIYHFAGAAFKLLTDHFEINMQPGRHSVEDASNCSSVRFAEAGKSPFISEYIRHSGTNFVQK